MRKYWAVFKITWQNAVEYRMEFIGHMMLGLISLLVMFFIWSAVFKDRQFFGEYTFSSMMTYLVLVRFLHFVKRSNIGREIAEEIKEGRLSAYLLRPVKYLRWWLSSFLAERIFEFGLRMSMLFVFLYFFPKVFNFPGFNRFLTAMGFLVISLFLNFLINILIAVLAFFVTDVRLFRSTVLMTFDFFAGSLIPLDLLPGFMKKIGFILPFQFWVYFPIKIYQGSLTSGEIFKGFVLCFVWILILLFIVNSLWQKGVKRYEAIGQ